MSGGDRILQANAARKRMQQNAGVRIEQEVDEYVNSQRTDRPSENISQVDEADRLNSAGEKARIGQKFRMVDLVEEYADLAMGCPELEVIFDEVRKYGQQNVTAASKQSEYMAEKETVKKLKTMIVNYRHQLDLESLDIRHETLSDYERMHVIADLDGELTRLTTGDLDVAMEKADSENPPVFIKYSETNKVKEKNSEGEARAVRFDSAADEPLFPHEPCANDVSQGYLGDCYFVATLSGIADRHPDKIRNMMQDNNDGTVTVKFYQMTKGNDGTDHYTPLFVTVDKTIPTDKRAEDDRYATHSLWVQVFERAYAASGLRVDAKAREDNKHGLKTYAEYDENYINEATLEDPNPWQNKYVRPVPSNINEMYEQIKSGILPKPSHEDCPWLVDAEGKLHEWKPSYIDIESGASVEVIRDVFGPEYDCREYLFRKSTGYFVCKDGKLNNEIGHRIIRKSMAENDEYFSDATYKEKAARTDDINYSAEVTVNFFLGEKMEVHMPGTSEEEMSPENLMKVVTLDGIERKLESSFRKIDLTGTREADIQQIREKFAETLTEAKAGLDGQLAGVGLADKKAIISANMDRYTELMVNHLTENIDNIYREKEFTRETVPYSGDYNGRAKFIYDKINAVTGPGNVIFAGTPKIEDKDSPFAVPGILGPHEYTVLGTQTKMFNGKELKFVRLRNPHAQNIVEYTPSPDGTKLIPHEARAKDSEGYFDIELNDFFKAFSDLDYTKVNENTRRREADERLAHSQQVAQANTVTDEQVKKMVDESRARSAYDKILEDISRNFEATHGKLTHDSQEFKDLEEAVRTTRTTLMDGGPNADVNISRDFSVLMMKSRDYLEHCKALPKSDSRRAQRVAICEALCDVVWMRQQGELHPKEVIQKGLVDKVFDSLNTAVRGNPALAALTEKIASPPVRELAAKNYVKSPEFRKSIGSDYVSMIVAGKMSIEELGKFAKKTMTPTVAEPSKPRLQEKTHTAGRSGLY